MQVVIFNGYKYYKQKSGYYQIADAVFRNLSNYLNNI